ncbi:hypothetical protein L6452_01320 [Arctium lappa]|uniref:Uncharacterized protein n=1 Tax=Arctium lappa TaxID=4217 RepID=A0ACB9FH62_ARCLA|nr:hypothetical protein L6452_01320 [Arctium lappa]
MTASTSINFTAPNTNAPDHRLAWRNRQKLKGTMDFFLSMLAFSMYNLLLLASDYLMSSSISVIFDLQPVFLLYILCFGFILFNKLLKAEGHNAPKRKMI